MSRPPTPQVTLAQLAQRLGGELCGDGATPLVGINTLERAGPGEISFLANPRYRAQLDATRAAAVIVSPAERDATALPRIVTPNPYLYFARVTGFFHPEETPPPGIHPSALIEPGPHIAATTSVGPFVHIAAGARIGERCIIGAHVDIGRDSEIGDDTRIYPRVVIYHECVIGRRVILHSGVVIGADGFGLAPDEGRWVKIPQVGRALIGDDCEIGANSTVDRGALDDTVLEQGVKLDNLVQIAHNVRVGAHTAMAACSGIAGSARIGAHCTIGGNSGVIGHVTVCDHAHISAFTMVTKSITQPGQYTSQLPLMSHQQWLKSAAHLRRLDRLAERLSALESRLKACEPEPGAS